MTVHAAPDWQPEILYRALSSRVLVVARTRIEGKWAAYCDAVPGQSHRNELEPVLDHGAKVDERIARVLFPTFDHLPYAG